MWFKDLMGFHEISPENVRDNIDVIGNNLVSRVNNRSVKIGELDVSTLEQLKSKIPNINSYTDKVIVSEVVDDIQSLHCDPKNNMALFQAASQFNLLEMIGPGLTPEDGVDIYDRDYTQGPACAIACGAGTIYRNYFANVNARLGQTKDNQIDCLELISKELGNNDSSLWRMINGYALLKQDGLTAVNMQLSRMNDIQRESLKSKLKIGIQWNTEVTIASKEQVVSQAYCSALPISYSDIECSSFEPFARLILEATYEATLYAALVNLKTSGSNIVYLTFVGGGAFGNDMNWIMESLERSIKLFRCTPLNIKIVSFNNSNPRLQKIISQF